MEDNKLSSTSEKNEPKSYVIFKRGRIRMWDFSYRKKGLTCFVTNL